MASSPGSAAAIAVVAGSGLRMLTSASGCDVLSSLHFILRFDDVFVAGKEPSVSVHKGRALIACKRACKASLCTGESLCP